MDWEHGVRDSHLFSKLLFLGTYLAPWISYKVKARLYLGHLVSSEKTSEVPDSSLDSAECVFRQEESL